jgi:hypothetical protein
MKKLAWLLLLIATPALAQVRIYNGAGHFLGYAHGNLMLPTASPTAKPTAKPTTIPSSMPTVALPPPMPASKIMFLSPLDGAKVGGTFTVVYSITGGAPSQTDLTTVWYTRLAVDGETSGPLAGYNNIPWDTTGLVNGWHQLQAIAFNFTSQILGYQYINVNVQN